MTSCIAPWVHHIHLPTYLPNVLIRICVLGRPWSSCIDDTEYSVNFEFEDAQTLVIFVAQHQKPHARRSPVQDIKHRAWTLSWLYDTTSNPVSKRRVPAFV